jgi:prephenate dehydratase
MRYSKQNQRVAFQGERGAFSEEAAIALLGDEIELVPRPTFESLFTSIEEDAADLIIAPVENTLAGTVHRCYELLIESDLNVIGESVVPIRHNLIGCEDASPDSVLSVESHPVALAQCLKFFAARPQIEGVATDDTAASVRRVVESGDRTRAAIGSARAAEIYGGKILQSEIEDHHENYTRFFLLSNETNWDIDADKISLVMMLPHKSGALYQALEPFARRRIDLVKIESYPIEGRPWEYRFYMDLQSSIDSVRMEVALDELKERATEVRILGSYKSAGRKQTATIRG